MLGGVDAQLVGELEGTLREGDRVASTVVSTSHPARCVLVRTILADVQDLSAEHAVSLESFRDVSHIFLSLIAQPHILRADMATI